MTLIYNSSFKFPIFTSKDKFEISKQFVEYMEKLPQYPNTGGNSTTNGNYILDMPKFKELKSFIEKHLNEYFHEILQISDKIEIYITQSWLNFNPMMTQHHQHSHPNSLVSGSFYIQGEPNTPICFERKGSQLLFGSSAWDIPFKSLNQYNDNRFVLNNELHKLTLFPSHLQHDVPMNPNRTTRISLAFNTFMRGKLGNRQTLTGLELK